jgi:hypothetical protein
MSENEKQQQPKMANYNLSLNAAEVMIIRDALQNSNVTVKEAFQVVGPIINKINAQVNLQNEVMNNQAEKKTPAKKKAAKKKAAPRRKK